MSGLSSGSSRALLAVRVFAVGMLVAALLVAFARW